MSLWTTPIPAGGYPDDELPPLDLSKPIQIDEEALRASLEGLAEQLRPFQTPPGCTGCGGCKRCLVILP